MSLIECRPSSPDVQVGFRKNVVFIWVASFPLRFSNLHQFPSISCLASRNATFSALNDRSESTLIEECAFWVILTPKSIMFSLKSEAVPNDKKIRTSFFLKFCLCFAMSEQPRRARWSLVAQTSQNISIISGKKTFGNAHSSEPLLNLVENLMLFGGQND